MAETADFMEYAYFRKNIVEFEKAQISIAANSLQYGTLAFGGIRGYHRNGKTAIFRLKDHHERLMNASKMLGFEYYIEYEEFKNVMGELIKKNNVQGDFYIRPFIFCDTPRIAPKKPGLEFDLAVYFLRMDDYVKFDGGVRFMSSTYRKYNDASIPTKAKAGGAYINSFLATSDAIRNGYDEALMMDDQGNVVEAAVANVLVVYRGILLIPDTGAAALEGITIRTVVELLEYAGYNVERERIDRSMIFSADELLVTGTAMKVVYAESLDGRPIGTPNYSEAPKAGKFCKFLQEEFEKVINGDHEKSKDWLEVF